jgi:eukaryotic-like serine/threonine-protein kinase
VLEELQPGDPVQVGPYRLAGVLGAGGMGRVFLGLPPDGRPVAVKVIRSELAADPEFRVRFRREVDAARAISGLYTAELVDADTDSPVPWLATAYLDGPSLSEAVTSYGPLSAASVRALAAGLAEALASVHAMGLVHRDIKPSNVLLASDGPRVIDFGISRAAEATALTSTGQFIGSPGYLSPEQATGRKAGPPSDIFSLGAVLAFAATGNGPFGTGSTPALVYRVVHEPPTMEGVPEELQPLIGMCLAKEPEDRPTASDLVAELAGAQRLHERTAAARAGFAEPTPTQSVPGAAVNGAPPAAGAVALGSGGPRRLPRLRRSLLIPLASAAAVVAAAVAVLATTLGSPGGSSALAGGSPTASTSAVAAAAHSGTPTAGISSPPPTASAAPTGQGGAQEAPATQSPSSATQSPSSEQTVTETKSADSPTSHTPTVTQPGPKSISGTYTFTRQVVTCTFSSCGTTPIVVTFACPSAGSCTAYWSYWGTHAASFDGSTVDASFTATGSINCKGTALPTAVTLDINVLSWTAGQGGAVRTPTQMQGTYTESAPASDLGCKAAGTQQTVSYG